MLICDWATPIAMTGGVQEYLASGEEISHEWRGKISDGARKGAKVTLVATDRRLAYLTEESFKDIGYAHISSLESETNEVPDIPWIAVLVGVSGLFGVFTVLGGLMGGNVGAFAIGVVLLVISFLLYQWRPEGGINNEPTVKQSVTIVTDDVRENEINFETTENIGADLSKTIRNRA